MSIEDKIFNRYIPDFNKLKSFGFEKIGDNYTIEKLFNDNLFKAIITVNPLGNVDGRVYDVELDDEYLPLRIENNQGKFVNEVKSNYENLLINIRDNCFKKQYFIYPQTNRICNLIIKKYKNMPEFLWEKTPGSGIFRNQETKKWYLAILDIDRSKIQKGKSGLIEVGLIKLNPDKIQEMIKQKDYYPAYHMNKKHWLTIIFDDSLSDKKIMELIDESHNFTVKK